MSQLYRITPLEKKSVEFVVETYELGNDGEYLRGFTVRELYRWGQGFREMDNWVSDWEVKQGVNCNPAVGWGCELDDLISISIEFDGEFTEEEEAEITARCEGDLEDEEGRWGTSWIFDGDHNFQIEMDEVIIYGPVMIDLVEESGYGDEAIVMRDVQPRNLEDT